MGNQIDLCPVSMLDRHIRGMSFPVLILQGRIFIIPKFLFPQIFLFHMYSFPRRAVGFLFSALINTEEQRAVNVIEVILIALVFGFLRPLGCAYLLGFR